MSGLKVGEYFQLPLEPIDYQNGIIDCNGFGVLFADLHEKEKEALCVAINSHDQLVDTITKQEKVIMELVETLSTVMSAVNEYINYEHNGDPWSEDARVMGEMELNELSNNGFIDSVNQILAKHKQSKGD